MVEGPSLYPHLTGPENLRVYARLTGVARGRIPSVLDRVGLAAARKKRVKAYSLGMRQRLGLAVAMLHEPDIFILDEPTNGLDPAGVREMRDLFRDLASSGRTVFVSSHLLAEVEQVATHVAVIVGGRLVFQGGVGDLQRRTRAWLEADIDDDAAGRRVCAELDVEPDISRRGDRTTLRVRASDADAATLNAALVSAGVRVSRLAETRPNLEEAFFDLTTTSEPLPVPAPEEVST
jgi:ABC-2 type transport system ATP-binding protein